MPTALQADQEHHLHLLRQMLFIRKFEEKSAELYTKEQGFSALVCGRRGSGSGSSVVFSSFCESGRLNYLLEKVSVNIILNSKAALLGAAWYADNH